MLHFYIAVSTDAILPDKKTKPSTKERCGM